MHRCVLSLSGLPAEVPDARAFTSRTLASWGLSALADNVVLLVSELATNAVLHARSGYDLVLERRREVVRISVLDDSHAVPRPRGSDLSSTGGRGLALVETLSTRWGRTDENELGRRAKGVWFEVPTDPALLPAEPEGALYGEDWLALLDDDAVAER